MRDMLLCKVYAYEYCVKKEKAQFLNRALKLTTEYTEKIFAEIASG